MSDTFTFTLTASSDVAGAVKEKLDALLSEFITLSDTFDVKRRPDSVAVAVGTVLPEPEPAPVAQTSPESVPETAPVSTETASDEEAPAPAPKPARRTRKKKVEETKRRGRPKGSKNKPKPAPYVVPDFVLEMPGISTPVDFINARIPYITDDGLKIDDLKIEMKTLFPELDVKRDLGVTQTRFYFQNDPRVELVKSDDGFKLYPAQNPNMDIAEQAAQEMDAELEATEITSIEDLEDDMDVFEEPETIAEENAE